MTSTDWADEVAYDLARDIVRMNDHGCIIDAPKFAAALRKAKADGERAGSVAGLREAADMLLPANNSGLAPYSALRHIYDEYRARADMIEEGEG